MFIRRLICMFLVLVCSVCFVVSASALEASTLHNGSRGENVRSLQQALIQLGFLKGKADGIFGNQTEKAVCAFQAANKLKVDGLAGKKTQALLFEKAGAAPSAPVTAAEPAPAAEPVPAAQTPAAQAPAAEAAAVQPAPSSASVSSGGSLFSGNYATIRIKDRGDRVRIMQQALIRLNYLKGKADGIFGAKTLDAVLLFQQENHLSTDGLAGKKTLKALETADKNGAVRGSASSSSQSSQQTAANIAEETAPAKASTASSSSSPSSSTVASAPSVGSLRLLHWFNDVKPALKSGNHLLIYDPASGISWTLRVHSCGRHCDAEPLTAQDTENMVKAFGGKNTWDQKGVYVRLPSGVWTIGSTHDMPHMSGHVTDNNFNGHLCVHFLRDMSEAEANDPNYGVANQKTIRALWKSLTGEELTN